MVFLSVVTPGAPRTTALESHYTQCSLPGRHHPGKPWRDAQLSTNECLLLLTTNATTGCEMVVGEPGFRSGADSPTAILLWKPTEPPQSHVKKNECRNPAMGSGNIAECLPASLDWPGAEIHMSPQLYQWSFLSGGTDGRECQYLCIKHFFSRVIGACLAHTAYCCLNYLTIVAPPVRKHKPACGPFLVNARNVYTYIHVVPCICSLTSIYPTSSDTLQIICKSVCQIFC